MHTGHQEQPEQGIQGEGEGAESRDGNTDTSIQDQPSIAQLQSAADEFQAAFNTALYELETSRRKADERAARIEDLNESIVTLNNALAEQSARADSKSQAVDTLEKQVAAAESEHATLTAELSEQSRSREMQLEQINHLSSQVEDLTGEINQQKSAGLQVAEEYARERSQLGSHMAKLKELYNDACYRLDEAQQEITTSQAKLKAGNETVAKLNAELDGLRSKLDEQSVAMASQNENFVLKDNEISALQGTIDELLGHREKIESLNRALHESSISENGIHQKILEEKDSMIAALKERLSSGANESAQAASAESDRLKAELDARDARLHEQDVEIQSLAGQAASAAELEARVSKLSSELADAKAEGERQLESADVMQSLQVKVDELAAELARVVKERDELAAQLKEYKRPDQPVVPAAESEQEVPQPVAEMPVIEAEEPAVAVHSKEETVVPDLEETVATREESPAEELDFSAPAYAEQPADNTVESSLASMDQADEASLEVQPPEVESSAGADAGMQLQGSESAPVAETAGELELAPADVQEAPIAEDAPVTETAGGLELAPVDVQETPVAEDVPVTAETAVGLELAPEEVQEAPVADDVSTQGSTADNAATVDVAMPGGGNEFGDFIRDILECNRLRLYFQPIPALVADINNCFEVLARFVGPDDKLILPGEVFEKAGSAAMTAELDRRIVEASIIKLAKSEISDMKLFVKLTRQSVTDYDFPVWVMGKLKEHGVKANRLVFEIDENTMEKELKDLTMLSRALSAMGCMVSIEHYRMQSAPECLDQIHVDYLKLDRQLVHEIGSNEEHLGTVTKIMDLARSKGYLTVAEGVENPEDLAKLWELGVSQAQGFFIYEPSGEMDMEMTGSDDSNKEADGKATFTHG